MGGTGSPLSSGWCPLFFGRLWQANADAAIKYISH